MHWRKINQHHSNAQVHTCVYQLPNSCNTVNTRYIYLLAVHSSVHVKIADLGISQTMTPGGVMGFKGSPGFMAPEILKYVGQEACTEKVDIFSYAMFLYEMISLYFPFEKQNLMKAQIEKLVTEEERPSLQSRVGPCTCNFNWMCTMYTTVTSSCDSC